MTRNLVADVESAIQDSVVTEHVHVGECIKISKIHMLTIQQLLKSQRDMASVKRFQN